MYTDANVFVPESEAALVLKRYNITYPDYGLAKNPEEAIHIADKIGYPVVLKIVSPDIIHKSDVGGVFVGMNTKDDVRNGYRSLVNKIQKKIPEAEIHGVLVANQCKQGLETIIGAIRDSVFGPTVMAGIGGVFTEVMNDITFRIAPLERIDAEEMIEELKGSILLRGFRGQGPYDVKAFANALTSVSRLIMENEDIVELDLNPVRLYESGLMALDVRLIKYG